MLPFQLPTVPTCQPLPRSFFAALAARPLKRESLSTSTAGGGPAVVAVGEALVGDGVVAVAEAGAVVVCEVETETDGGEVDALGECNEV